MNSLGLSIIFRMGCLCSRESVRVKSKKYIVKDLIGEGGFSRVYMVEDIDTKKEYALKKIICHSPEDEVIAMNEVRAHEKVQHNNVIRLIDFESSGIPDPVTNSTSQVCLVLPFYKKGTLLDELERRSVTQHSFDPVEAIQLFLAICEGVKAFHNLNQPLAHRDLKTANILITSDGVPIIMDLGSAAPARVEVQSSSQAQNLQDLAAERCSMPYKAPELFNVEMHCTIDERTDIWSLGCILYAICFFKSPYDVVYERGDSVALAVLSGNMSFPNGHMYGPDMENLILFMLQVDSKERPFITNVIEKSQELLRKYTSCV